MKEFNCTVKDIFRRANMIDLVVRRLADNGYTEYASVYAQIRENLYNALEYASSKMRKHEYDVALSYFYSKDTEQTIADTSYYTHRTIRRYVLRACNLISEYYAEFLDIVLLPNDARAVINNVAAGTFWEKVDSLMKTRIENACVAILCCLEHQSVNSVCSCYSMGSDKVKKIIRAFGSVVTVYDIPEEKRSAV